VQRLTIECSVTIVPQVFDTPNLYVDKVDLDGPVDGGSTLYSNSTVYF